MTEKYAGMSKDVSGQNVGAVKAARDSDSVKSMEHNLRVRTTCTWGRNSADVESRP